MIPRRSWHWTHEWVGGQHAWVDTVPTPTLTDVLAARRLLAASLPPTPAWSYPALDAVAGATVIVKHENVQPTGAFKVRGGLVLLAGMAATDRDRGLVTWSTGNHAQSIAYAAHHHRVRCTVVMPTTASAAKRSAVEALGAEVRLGGRDMSEAAVAAKGLADDRGAVLVSPGDTAALIAGVATTYWELHEQAPGLDAVVVPVGSGTGAAAACLVTAAVAPGCEVVAVQSAASPAAHDAWRSGEPARRSNRTVVEGLATGASFALPQSLLGCLTDFVLVSDEQIHAAAGLLATHAHTLAEGAGAAALAAVLSDDRFRGRRVAVVCTGGNATPAELARLAAAAAPTEAAATR